MTTPQDTTPALASVPPGQIQFIDNFLPVLEPGQYAVNVTQTLGGVAGAIPFSETLTLTVGGAGLVLGAPDVASVYPPAGSSADYGNVLPHIVLNVRTLPWEEQLSLTPADKTVPWLALVVFADGEVVMPAPVAASQLSQVPAGTLAPVPPAAEVANTTSPVTVVDVPAALFAQVMPKLGEAAMLAHCREISVATKSTSSTSTSEYPGWYSVVVGNRFGSVPATAASVTYTAHLVSLAGLEPYLSGTALPAGIGTVRLVSLSHWSYTSLAAGLDFRQLMTNMVAPPAGTAQGDMSYMLLRLPPVPAAASPDALHSAVQQVLHAGYVAVPYTTREGDAVTAWYRGPFTPAPVTPIGFHTITMGSEAIIYDQVSGMFDLSYSAAWETGRLLALSDRSFASSLVGWRGQGQRLLDQLHFNIQQNPALRGLMEQPSPNADVQQLRSLLEPDLLQGLVPGAAGVSSPLLSAVVQLLAQDQDVALPQSFTVPTPSNAAPPVPAVPQAVSSALTALVSQPWVTGAIASMTQLGMSTVSEWLAKLALCDGVPFNNLVPDPRMLPAESLRFFYIDQNWIDAMVDGALSTGVHSSRDTQYNDMMRDSLQDAVNASVSALRAVALGMPPANDAPAGVMTGMLMRSEVVSGWPTLEVRAYQPGATPGSFGAPMMPLRMDHVASDVLLCIFPSAPARIEISQPHESLRFGVEDEGELELRSVSASGPPGAVIGQAHVALRPAPAAVVLDVTGTLSAIATAQPQLSGVGPAGFAVQMIDAPEQVVFYGAAS